MPPSSKAAEFFVDQNFAGQSVALPSGAYDIEHVEGSVGNDTISSIRVASGYQVTVYTDSGFAGQSKTFTADTAYVGDDFNDAISSFQVNEVGSTAKLKNITLTGFPPQNDVYQLKNPVDL